MDRVEQEVGMKGAEFLGVGGAGPGSGCDGDAGGPAGFDIAGSVADVKDLVVGQIRPAGKNGADAVGFAGAVG